ncbi:MAG: family 10 glycosylhydrolase [Bacteroidota bacterium]
MEISVRGRIFMKDVSIDRLENKQKLILTLMNRWFTVFFTLSILLSCSLAQVPPKREFRGAWVATVQNIDWPVTTGTNVRSTQVSELSTLLDSLQKVGVNAMVFQIRPSCDAYYKSAIEPWSQWLTGTQGVPPTDASYDPLQEAIKAAHDRGMELHAWFNPYRAVINTSSSSVASSHISVTRPDLVKSYAIFADSSGKRVLRGFLKMLDPGLPEVRAYVTGVIMDVTRRYDIDGVHFDDYFYPYPTTDSLNQVVPFPDSDTYAANNPGGLPLSDWRRGNVNALIHMISDSLKVVKPKVKFGISPFGIWKSGVPPGISGLSAYSEIYCDAITWLQEGWIDYLTPQLYWVIGGAQDYSKLMPWWGTNSYARHIYPGQATYHIQDVKNWPIAEIANQISLNRVNASQGGTVLGSVHFSAKYFRTNTKSLNDSLRKTVYSNYTKDPIPRTFALLPTMAWKDSVPPNRPESLEVRYFSFGTARLRWHTPSPSNDGEPVSRYVVYRSFNSPIDMNNVAGIFTVIKDTVCLVEQPTIGGQVYNYAISAIDRQNNESPMSNVMAITSTGVEDLKVQPEAFALYQNFPNPFNPATAISYQLSTVSNVTLKVYDVLGREVRVLVDGIDGPGYHRVQFDGSGLSSGVYFYRLIAGGRVETKKMQLIR